MGHFWPSSLAAGAGAVPNANRDRITKEMMPRARHGTRIHGFDDDPALPESAKLTIRADHFVGFRSLSPSRYARWATSPIFILSRPACAAIPFGDFSSTVPDVLEP